jgi:hypothetical protein
VANTGVHLLAARRRGRGTVGEWQGKAGKEKDCKGLARSEKEGEPKMQVRVANLSSSYGGMAIGNGWWLL